MKPKDYVSFDQLQKCNVSNLIDEFEEELIQMSGKCMDVGCGHERYPLAGFKSKCGNNR